MSLNCTVTELATPSYSPALCPCCTATGLPAAPCITTLFTRCRCSGPTPCLLSCSCLAQTPHRQPFQGVENAGPKLPGRPFLLLSTLQILFEFGGRSYMNGKRKQRFENQSLNHQCLHVGLQCCPRPRHYWRQPIRRMYSWRPGPERVSHVAAIPTKTKIKTRPLTTSSNLSRRFRPGTTLYLLWTIHMSS